jgi:hypothetical protein
MRLVVHASSALFTGTFLPTLQLLAPEFLVSVDELSASFRKNKACPHVVIESFLGEDFCAKLTAGFPACDQDVLSRFQANNQRGGMSKKLNICELGVSFIAFDRLM